MHEGVEEFYYVMNGEGRMTVSFPRQPGSDTATARPGDAIPIRLGELHSFENAGTAPVEVMIVGVSSDSDANHKSVDTLDGSAITPGPRGV